MNRQNMRHVELIRGFEKYRCEKPGCKNPQFSNLMIEATVQFSIRTCLEHFDELTDDFKILTRMMASIQHQYKTQIAELRNILPEAK